MTQPPSDATVTARARRVRTLLGGVALLVVGAAFAHWYNRTVEGRYTVVRADPVTIDVNHSGPEWLEQLPGVGPGLAERIVRERERGGLYRDLDDLILRVDGLGGGAARSLVGVAAFPR